MVLLWYVDNYEFHHSFFYAPLQVTIGDLTVHTTQCSTLCTFLPVSAMICLSVCPSVYLSVSLSPFDRLLVYQVFLNIFTFDCKKLCPVEKVTQEHWTCVWCIDLESFNIELIYRKIVRNSYVIFDPIKVYAFGKVMVL